MLTDTVGGATGLLPVDLRREEPAARVGRGTTGRAGPRGPAYLVDDTGAFADDRWFAAPVITPDDEPARPRE